MKTAEEVRRHRDNLLVAMKMPCDCERAGHSEQCRIGAKMMNAVARTLTWVLGEDDGREQPMIDNMRDAVSAFQRTN